MQAEIGALTKQLEIVGGSAEGELKRAGAELAAAARERAALEAQLGVAKEQLAAARAHGEALSARVQEAERELGVVRASERGCVRLCFGRLQLFAWVARLMLVFVVESAVGESAVVASANSKVQFEAAPVPVPLNTPD